MVSNSFSHGKLEATTIAALHSDIIETHILPKFDGQSLASAASTCHLLHTLCSRNEHLWEDICNSTWNSIKHPLVQQTISTFPRGYHSFFSDSFPIIHPKYPSFRGGEIHTPDLISAVDICYGKDIVYSKVRVTRTDNNSFLESSLCLDLLDDKETAKMPLKYEGDELNCMKELEENLTLSWIIIDPSLKRAANMSSLKAVSIRPHWDGTAIKATFATIISGDGINTTEFVECKIVAIFGYEDGKYIQLREISLCVVDMHRRRLSGEKCLRILEGAMESGERKKVTSGGVEVKEVYTKYVDLKRKTRDEMKRLNMDSKVLKVADFMVWVFFVISLLFSLYGLCN